MTELGALRPRNVRLVARVDCRLPSGVQQRLYATRLGMTSVSILALRAVSLGEELELVLHPLGQRPLPPLRAKITRVRSDSALGEWSDFEASFVEPSDSELDRLATAIIGIDDIRSTSPTFAERRGALRIRTELPVLVETENETCRGLLADLSLTGALLCLPKQSAECILAVDAPMDLTIALSASATLQVRSRVTWATVGPLQRLAGVQFVDCDPSARAFLQEVLFQALTSAAEARLRT